MASTQGRVAQFLANAAHPEDLTHDEVLEIAESKHVTAEQLNLLAAHTQRLNLRREAELRELQDRMERIETAIRAIQGKSS